MKKTKIIFLIVVLLLCLSFVFAGCNKRPTPDLPDTEDPDAVFNFGKSFGVRPTDEFVRLNNGLTIDTDLVNRGINGTSEEMAAAIVHLFNVAETNKRNASWFHVRSACFGEAYTTFLNNEVGGKMDIRCITVYNRGEWYDHINGVLVEGIPAWGYDIAMGLLNYSQRKYHYVDDTGEYFYREKTTGKKADADYDEITGIPTGSFYNNKDTDRKEYHSVEAFNDDNFILNYPLETMCLDITADSIDPDRELTLSYANGMYTMSFSVKIPAHSLEEANALDTSSEEYKEISEYAKYKRDALRASVDSKNLEVVKLDYKMEIWDNGYYKNSTSYECWYATLDVTSFLKPTGSSDNYDCKTFSWDVEDCNVSEYKGGEWYKGHNYTIVGD